MGSVRARAPRVAQLAGSAVVGDEWTGREWTGRASGQAGRRAGDCTRR